LTGATASDIPDDVPPIRTERLELVSMSVPFLEALARRDVEAATGEIGAEVPPWLPEQLEHFVQYRLATLRVDPSARPWLGRALVLSEEAGRRRVIGTAGFHAPPDTEGRVEIGYRIDPAYRRQGYAIEAVRGLFDWAAAQGVHRFIASISPDNEASLSLAWKLGFQQVGKQVDDIDGLELVFETSWPQTGT
jgi:[ribosomal protein S5]-alanine N-acetyltransferase